MSAIEVSAKLSYTVDEAAKAIGLSSSTVWKMIAEKELATFKWRGRTLIAREDLQRARDTAYASGGQYKPRYSA